MMKPNVSTRKIKKIMIAFLAVMMLVVSSALMVSAYESPTQTYYVYGGSSYFNARMRSTLSGNSIATKQLYTADATGVTTTTNARSSFAIAYGYLSSLKYQGMTINVKFTNIAVQAWNASSPATPPQTQWFSYITGEQVGYSSGQEH